MENRFGPRDALISGLFVLLIVVVSLAMLQYDRQWKLIQALSSKVDEQAGSQARLERTLGDIQASLEDLSSRPVVIGDARPAAGGEAADGQASEGVWQTGTDPFARRQAAAEMPDYAAGDWVIDAFGAKVARITPLVSGDVYGNTIAGYALESLLQRDPETLDWQPLLARRWRVSDDGLTITFQLRRGVTFSDGEPLDSSDVIFTWNLINNEDVEAPRARNYFDKIQSVEATGPYEVVFTFKEPYYEALGMAGGMEILPEHFYSRYSPQEINEIPGLLLGSGPYRMETPDGWTPGSPLILYRNPRYWGLAPAFDRLVYREIDLDPARLTEFRNGAIDLFSAMPEQYIAIKDDPAIQEKAKAFEYERPNAGYGFIAWNQRRDGRDTFFADRRVRRAMTMLIDRERISDELLLGFGIIPSGPFNRLTDQYNPEVEPLPHDPEQARALLKEAGFEDRNDDGLLDGPDGAPFTFRYTYPTSGPTGFWDRLALFLKDAYAAHGIDLRPDPLEWAVFAEKLSSRRFDAISLAWSAGIESDIRQMFHSSQIADNADNFMSYSNPAFDEAVDQARRTLDREERMKLWRECHRILNEDQPYTFLYSRKALMFVDRRIHNVEQIRLGLNDRTEWYVPAGEQKWGVQ